MTNKRFSDLTDLAGLTILGRKVQRPVSQIEVFPAPDGIEKVVFETEEFTAVCPITKQPDLYRLVLTYIPTKSCIESKSLKLYLWQFRNQGIFAEALAARIANDIGEQLQPLLLTVELTQHVRGGLVLSVTASWSQSFDGDDYAEEVEIA